LYVNNQKFQQVTCADVPLDTSVCGNGLEATVTGYAEPHLISYHWLCLLVLKNKIQTSSQELFILSSDDQLSLAKGVMER
jgi:hypothetical protein